MPCFGSTAQLVGILVAPTRIEPGSPAGKLRVLANGPPGIPPNNDFLKSTAFRAGADPLATTDSGLQETELTFHLCNNLTASHPGQAPSLPALQSLAPWLGNGSMPGPRQRGDSHANGLHLSAPASWHV